MSGRKDDGIESLRGLAILLMVAGHVIGSDSSTGLTVSDDSPLRYLYYSTQFVRMPLFTVISGFVYSLRPLSDGGCFPQFIRGKARRILLPLVSVSTLHFLARAAMTDVNRSVPLSDLWRVYFYPFDHFWFLQSIFLVFLTVGALDYGNLMSDRRRWLGCFGLALAATFLVPRFTSLFGFNGYLYLLPYFLLGCGLCRFPALFRHKLTTYACVVILCAATLAQQLAWFGAWAVPLDRVGLVALGVGIPTGILLISHRFERRWLAWIGQYSFGIYLFHVFGTAGCRMASTRAGINSELVLLIASLAAGVALPIVLERFMMQRAPLMQLCLFGVTPRRPARRRPTSFELARTGAAAEALRG